MSHLLHTAPGTGPVLEVTPSGVPWSYLGFRVASLEAGQSHRVASDGVEIAFVPLAGSMTFVVGDQRFDVTRSSVFEALPHILYVPPGHEVEIEATTDCELAWGSAPAEGTLPLRMFRPDEMKQEVRGGGPAVRQVNHVLAHPLPAERLILFEVYVPGGAWSGWPPHCHDGRRGSAYLEETYYYRIRPSTGFAMHRNYTREGDMDEIFAVRDGDLVLVTGGYHPVAAAPGSSVYFLNFLAGELVGDERGRAPVDDPDHEWIKDDWDRGEMTLPLELDD